MDVVVVMVDVVVVLQVILAVVIVVEVMVLVKMFFCFVCGCAARCGECGGGRTRNYHNGDCDV